MTVETVDESICVSCGGSACRDVVSKRTYRIHECAICKLYFVHPQPNEQTLKQLYLEDPSYFQTVPKNLRETSPHAATDVQAWYETRGVVGERFLDIGCASGALLYHMRELGWNVSGVDLNERAIRIARSHGLDARLGTLENTTFAPNSFDAAHMGDLIEHVRSPRKLLQRTAELIAPGGLLSIVTPNSTCFFAQSSLVLSRLTGLPWAHSEAPYHLFDFSVEAINRLLRATSLQLVEVKYGVGPSLGYTVGATGYFDDLKREMKQSGRYRVTRSALRDSWKIAGVAALVGPLWGIGRLVDKITGRGGKLRVLAQKAEKPL